MPLIVGYSSASGRCSSTGSHPSRYRAAASSARTEHVDVVVHDRGAGVEARERGVGDVAGKARRLRVRPVDRSLDDDRCAAHGLGDGLTTWPTFAASVRAPSTWMGVPFTITCCMPTGWSAVRRSAFGREVAHAPDRTGRHGRGIEHDDVGPRAGPQVAAIGEAEDVGLHAGELADRLLHRHEAAVAHPVAEEVGGLRRVAQLADVGARVGEPERAVLVDQQVGHVGFVVVGDDAAHPERELGLVEREVEQRVERLDAALGGDVGEPAADELGVRVALPDRVGVPPRTEVPDARPALHHLLTPRGIGVRTGALVDRGVLQRGEALVHRERIRRVEGELEHERSGRHLRPHLGAAAPTRRRLTSSAFWWSPPGDVSSAPYVNGTPIFGWRSYMSAMPHCSPGAIDDDAAPDLAHDVEQRLELGAVGEAARHGLAVDAAVR